MHDSERHDPYASPVGDQSLQRKPIDMKAAFNFPFSNPGWFGNIFLVLLCMMIPVVGPIVFLGYKFELIEGLLDRPKDPCPSLDFGRFGDYLKRGVWPFVAALIAQLVMTPLIMLLMIPFMCLLVGPFAMLDDDNTEALGVICIIAAYAVMFVGTIAINVIAMCVVTPMMLGAGLSQDLAPAINFGYIKDFIRRTWKEMCLAYFWLMLATFLLMPLGLCFFFVGAYLVGAWAWIVMGHVYYQLYTLYLERGGEPIQPKADPQPAA